MQFCTLMDADGIECNKGCELEVFGICCKHCKGQAGCGRYFHATEEMFSQPTTLHSFFDHVRKCSQCPQDIRNQIKDLLQILSSKKPKYGGQKILFHRMWCWMQKSKELHTENEQVNDNKNDNLEINKLMVKLKVAEELRLQLLQSNYSQPKFFLQSLLTDKTLSVTKMECIEMLQTKVRESAGCQPSILITPSKTVTLPYHRTSSVSPSPSPHVALSLE